MRGLARELLYTEVQHLQNFELAGDLMEKTLYPLYLETCNLGYKWKNSPVETFNEVFYQLVRINLDPNPEEFLYENYIEDAREDMGSLYAANYVFCFVWLLTKLSDDDSSRVRYFLATLEQILSKDGNYFPYFKQWFEENSLPKYKFSFSPSPAWSTEEYSRDEWNVVTHNFDQSWIERIVKRCPDRLDRLAVLHRIESAFLGKPCDYVKAGLIPF